MGTGASVHTLTSEEIAHTLGTFGSAYQSYNEAIVANGFSGELLADIKDENELNQIMDSLKITNIIHRKNLLKQYLKFVKVPPTAVPPSSTPAVSTAPAAGQASTPAQPTTVPLAAGPPPPSFEKLPVAEVLTTSPKDLLTTLFATKGVDIDPRDVCKTVTTTLLPLITDLCKNAASHNVSAMKYDCYLGYRTNADIAIAESIYDILKGKGMNIFWDKKVLQKGEDWKTALAKGLQDCKYYLPLISTRALTGCKDSYADHSKDLFLLEMELAMKRKIAIQNSSFVVPLLIGDYVMDSKDEKVLRNFADLDGQFYSSNISPASIFQTVVKQVEESVQKAQIASTSNARLTFSRCDYEYDGELKDELPNGFGKAFFTRGPFEGVTYIGEFVDGRFEGNGSYQYPRMGYQYKGQFHCNKFSGLGIWSCVEEESKEEVENDTPTNPPTTASEEAKTPLHLSKQQQEQQHYVIGEWSDHMLKLSSPSCAVENDDAATTSSGSSSLLMSSHRFYGHHQIDECLLYDYESYPSTQRSISYTPKELFALLDTSIPPHGGVDFDPEDETWSVQKLYLYLKSTATTATTEMLSPEKLYDCLILHRPEMNMIIADTIQEYFATQPAFLPVLPTGGASSTTTAAAAAATTPLMKSLVITTQSIEEFLNLLHQTKYVLLILSSAAMERYKDPLLAHTTDTFLLQVEASLRIAIRTKRLLSHHQNTNTNTNTSTAAAAVSPPPPFLIPVFVGDYMDMEHHPGHGHDHGHHRVLSKFRLHSLEYTNIMVKNSSQRGAYLARQAAETADLRASEVTMKGSVHHVVSPTIHHSPGHHHDNSSAGGGGSIEGSSRLRYENGSSYQGELDGYQSRHGYGVYIASEEKSSIDWIAGSVYSGQFNNNYAEGYGVLQYSDGTRYEGEFLRGEKHGYGIKYYPMSNVKIEGFWSHDVFQKKH